MTHTPGPWNYQSAGGWISGPASLESIAKIVFKCDEYAPEKERLHDHANARLIAAAPDLLEALKAAHEAIDASYLDFVESDPNGPECQHLFELKERIGTAIAKAEGGQ